MDPEVDGKDPNPEAYFQKAANIEAKPVRWLWKPWIPEGVLCLLDGDPGVGKSTLAGDLAARVSRGSSMPLEAEPVSRSPGGVVICSAEDDFARTIKPRLLAANADMDRVFNGAELTVNGKTELFRLQDHLGFLKKLIQKNDVQLVIFDPLMAFICAQVNPNDERVRHVLLELKQLAEETRATILGIRHFKKGEARALYKGAGSVAILGTARAAMIVGLDPTEPGCALLAMNKGNLGPKPKSIQFKVEEVAVPDVGSNTRVTWVKEVNSTADDILQASALMGPGTKRQTKLSQAIDGLKLLLVNGPMMETTVKRVLKASHDIGDSTVDTAKDHLKVKPKRFGGRWYWFLPGFDWEGWKKNQAAKGQGEAA
jgi:hypothetical protein